jgi:fructan beta-fructosidase
LYLTQAQIKFNISEVKDKSLSFKLSNSLGDELLFGFDPKDNNFYVDRRKSGKVNFENRYASKISTATRISSNPSLNGTILLDKTSIELFYDDGEMVMTEIFFPNAPFERLSLVSKNEIYIFDYIEVNQLNFND